MKKRENRPFFSGPFLTEQFYDRQTAAKAGTCALGLGNGFSGTAKSRRVTGSFTSHCVTERQSKDLPGMARSSIKGPVVQNNSHFGPVRGKKRHKHDKYFV